MIQSMINGVCKAIYDNLGDKYEIYTESMEQKFCEPCFSVSCLNPTSERFMGNRFYYTVPVVIKFFPHFRNHNKREECYDVYEKLSDILEVITIGADSMRGVDIHSEYADGVLHTFVTYQYFSLKQKEKNYMENLKQKRGVV